MNAFPLATAAPAAHGIREDQLQRLDALIERHIADGHYPGCQIALARRGRLLLEKTFGHARTAPETVAAQDDTLWLLYSNTKVIVASVLWQLAEQGAFRFSDRLAAHVPEFSHHGKGDITILQIITHQGGFPGAQISREGMHDSHAMKASVCAFPLEWPPGSRVQYHGLSAHWALALLIETVTGRNFRDHVRDSVIEPLGLANDLFVGLPPAQDARVSDMHEPLPGAAVPPAASTVSVSEARREFRPLAESNGESWRRAGSPGGGGYGTARGMVALYQMMLAGGALGDARIVSPRMLDYAIRNHTGDRIDEYMGMPMHRGLGPHLRGATENIRGLGAIASPRTFGHGGVGSSYCWADPESGVSFAYLTNNRSPDPWHTERLDLVSNLVHAAILPD